MVCFVCFWDSSCCNSVETGCLDADFDVGVGVDYNVEFSTQPPLPPLIQSCFFCGEVKSASQPILSIYAASIKGRPTEKAAKTVLLRGTIKLEYDYDHQARAMTEPARSVVANMTLVSSCLFCKVQFSWYFFEERGNPRALPQLSKTKQIL